MLICTEDLRDDLVIDCKFCNNERVNKRIKYFLKEYYELLDRTSAGLPIKHASDVGIAGVLTQIDAKGVEKPITWISRALNSAEMKYKTTEKEALAIVWSIEKLKVYLANKFIIRTDHSALIWLMKQKNPARRLARWVMKL